MKLAPFLPPLLSVALHAGLAGLLVVVPTTPQKTRRPAIELTDRQLVDPQTAQPSEPPKAPQPPAPEPRAPAKQRRPRRRPPRPRPQPPAPAPEPGAEGAPESEVPPATETAAHSFGIEMEGTATAPPGSGVAVPHGQTLETDPGARRVGKGTRRGKRGSLRRDYAPGELAPIAVVTEMPKVLHRVSPEYPEEMRDLGIEGEVVTSLRIDAKGRVAAVRVLNGLHPVLDKAAKAAARKMRFTAAKVNGVPVAIDITFTFSFVLD